MRISEEEYLEHYGVKGMKWGVINEDKKRNWYKKPNEGEDLWRDARRLIRQRNQTLRNRNAERYRKEKDYYMSEKYIDGYYDRNNPEYANAKDYFSKNPSKTTYFNESSDREPTIVQKLSKGLFSSYTEAELYDIVLHGELTDFDPDLIKAAIEHFPRIKKAYIGAAYIKDRLGRDVRVNAKEVIEPKNRR